MPRFSLVQILAAVGALSAGLALSCLSGDWTDVPLIAIGLYFFVGLCRHAAATLARAAVQQHSSRDRSTSMPSFTRYNAIARPAMGSACHQPNQ